MKRRILLVDDDVPVLLTLKTILEMNDFEVETANSAAEAIAKLQANTYQAVITDVRMESEEAGFEVIRAAGEQPYFPATAILTAYPPHNGDHWKQRSAQSVLVKPVGTQDLVRQLEALLVRHEDEKQRRKAGELKSLEKYSTPSGKGTARKAS
jgi:DNA-binding NtrC family response regulator